MMPYAYNVIKTDPKFKKEYKEYRNSNFKLNKDPRVTKLEN